VDANPETRTRPAARDPISGVRQLTAVQRQASAADALSQPIPEALKLGNAFVDAAAPTAGELGPIRTFRDSPFGQLPQFYGDLVERHSDPLSEHDKSNPPEHCPLITAVARGGTLRLDQPFFFVEPKSRCGHPTAAGNLTDRKRSGHSQKISHFSS